MASLQKGAPIRERLARENPSVTQIQSELAASHANIGRLQRQMGRPLEALESHQQAHDLRATVTREPVGYTDPAQPGL